MALLPVLQIPDKRLKIKTQFVESIDNDLRAFLDDMIETMYVEDGAGLAATQVGSDKRLFVFDLGKKAGKQCPEIAINPDIYWMSSEKRPMREACLSVPFASAEVMRSVEIKVRYLDETGKTHDVHGTGLFAHVFQHEVDHLDGLVFLDRLPALKRRLLFQKALKGSRLS